jgi:hypothetical protein
MYCDDSSVKPADPKQVVVSLLILSMKCLMVLISYINRARRPMFYFTNVFDLRLQLVYSIFFHTQPSGPFTGPPPAVVVLSLYI